MNDLLHSITVDSTNSGLGVGTDPHPITISCGSWIADWQADRFLSDAFESDPFDSLSTMRGGGQITFGDGLAKFQDSPRLYISPPDTSIGWDNVEITGECFCVHWTSVRRIH